MEHEHANTGKESSSSGVCSLTVSRLTWLRTDRASALQVSFYRPNLHFSIVPKQYGETEDGLPLPFEALAAYIRWRSDPLQTSKLPGDATT
jgi:hypothetical protein